MDSEDTCNDPYSSIYQMPKKIKINSEEEKGKGVFNPYSKPTEEKKPETQEDLPKYVDLTKSAYDKKEASLDEEHEIPLLEELNICPENIKKKLISVLTFHKVDKQILEDADMTGPLLVFILFGISLVLVSVI
jgi:hypothetical protein